MPLAPTGSEGSQGLGEVTLPSVLGFAADQGMDNVVLPSAPADIALQLNIVWPLGQASPHLLSLVRDDIWSL